MTVSSPARLLDGQSLEAMVGARGDAGSVDVVVVGGGIAGCALATAVARDGLEVLVLEHDARYRDKVRGEYMAPWGVAETRRLGLEKTLLGAGGGYLTSVVGYDEVLDPAEALAGAATLDQMLPGVPGGLTVGHPQACAALNEAAVEAGAMVARGISEVTLGDGVVRYVHQGAVCEARCRLVVGADGRHSSVRRQLGTELNQTAARTVAAGMLVRGLDRWPAHQISVGTEGQLRYFVFPRSAGTARLYLVYSTVARAPFGGPNRVRDFLAGFALRCIPDNAAVFESVQAAGPYAAYPNTDGWTERPCAPGVVLIGDAAGWSDPITGQGLSVAMRDARTVADVLRAGSDWSPGAFARYVTERTERMRRLRITARVVTDMHATFTPEGAARRRAWILLSPTDPLLGGVEQALGVGPENIAAESFEPATIQRIYALTG